MNRLKLCACALFLMVILFSSALNIQEVEGAFNYNLVDQNTLAENGSQVALRDEHPSDHATYVSAGGIAIIPNSTYRLGYIEFTGYKTGSPTSDIICAIYAVSGIVGGGNAVPTGNALYYSDIVPASTFPTVSGWVQFNFSSSTVNINGGTRYAFSVEANTSNVDAGNFVRIRGSVNVASRSLNMIWFKNSAWIADNTYDFRYRIYELIEESPTIDYLGFNSTLNGSSSRFTYNFSDDYGLSHFIHGWNNSGAWVNTTYSLSGTDNQTFIDWTLNATEGVKVEYQVYVNDTDNMWGSTPLLFFNTNTKPIIMVGEGFLIMGVFFLAGVCGIIGYIAYSKH